MLALQHTKILRLAKNRSAAELSRRSGCSVRTIERIESERDRHTVTFATAKRLAGALEVAIPDLMGDEPRCAPADSFAAEACSDRVEQAFLAAEAAASKVLDGGGAWGIQDGLTVAALFAARFCFGMASDCEAPDDYDRQALAIEMLELLGVMAKRSIRANFDSTP